MPLALTRGMPIRDRVAGPQARAIIRSGSGQERVKRSTHSSSSTSGRTILPGDPHSCKLAAPMDNVNARSLVCMPGTQVMLCSLFLRALRVVYNIRDLETGLGKESTVESGKHSLT